MDRDPIVDALHGARLEQDITQQELANRIGVSRSSVAYWETDRCLPSLPKLCCWAEELGYDLVLVKRKDG